MHTPGPWKVGLSPRNVLAEDGYQVAYMASARPDEDSRDNARLIAAAPQLVAALEHAKVLLDAIVAKAGEFRLPETDCRLAHYAAYHAEAARAALAAAKGGA